MLPEVDDTTPAMALNKVVLPAPLGPMMARRWPRGTVRLTPSTALRASKATVTSVSVRIGSDTIFPNGHETQTSAPPGTPKACGAGTTDFGCGDQAFLMPWKVRE